MRYARTAATCLAACALAACAPGAGEQTATLPPATTVTSTSAVPPAHGAPPLSAEPGAEDPETQLARIAQGAIEIFGGEASVAVSNTAQTLTSGDARDYVAWSTIKIPIAVAALEADPSLLPVAEAAVTISDNGAAETLWSATTPADVEAVLAAAGTPIAVNAELTRPGFTPFGQTVFTTADQAAFAAGLPCSAASSPVLEMMGRITAEQRYGLGLLGGAQFKGGWGPDESGSYVVRQLGLVEGRGVALTAAPADGTYETAQRMASMMAVDVETVIRQLPPASCW
ncbi:hypothetical protein V6D40_04360 [Corynebacterium sp. Q4381]|uniref:hypothetical protein n=1 Tax=Corynebacterium sp. Marseille-Q4381 TaxID=3121597 RepID=UPI002FE5320B